MIIKFKSDGSIFKFNRPSLFVHLFQKEEWVDYVKLFLNQERSTKYTAYDIRSSRGSYLSRMSEIFKEKLC